MSSNSTLPTVDNQSRFLSEAEIDRLERLEATINRGVKTFLEVGNALCEIRDDRLYRNTHKTFECYLDSKWGMTRTRAYQLIDAAKAVEDLSTRVDKLPQTECQAREAECQAGEDLSTRVDVLPQTEFQARPLVALPPEKRREVWAEVVETAPAKKITAKHVRAVVDRHRGPKPDLSLEPEKISAEQAWQETSKFLEAMRRRLKTEAIDAWAFKVKAYGAALRAGQ